MICKSPRSPSPIVARSQPELSARHMGIAVVAVYSGAGAKALHVQIAEPAGFSGKTRETASRNGLIEKLDSGLHGCDGGRRPEIKR